MTRSKRPGLWHARDAVTSRLRLRDHDYTSPATYFVTLVTANRTCLFGQIEAGAMVLNEAGTDIDSWWHTIPARFPSVMLDAMVLMPNHLHGVISLGTDPALRHDAPSLSGIIGWFKTRTVNDYGLGVRTCGWPPYRDRLWQPGLHEHIIRSDSALQRVRAYIASNPAGWADDDENPANW